MRQYEIQFGKSKGQKFTGFDNNFNPLPQYIGLLKNDEIILVYALDNRGPSVDELRRFVDVLDDGTEFLGTY